MLKLNNTMTLVINCAKHILVTIENNNLQLYLISQPQDCYVCVNGDGFHFNNGKYTRNLCTFSEIIINNSSALIDQRLLNDNFTLLCKNNSTVALKNYTNHKIKNGNIVLVNSTCSATDCKMDSLKIESTKSPKIKSGDISYDYEYDSHGFTCLSGNIKKINYSGNAGTSNHFGKLTCNSMSIKLTGIVSKAIIKKVDAFEILIDSCAGNTLELDNVICSLKLKKEIKVVQTNCLIFKPTCFGNLPKCYRDVNIFTHS